MIQPDDFLTHINQTFHIEPREIQRYPALTLAYMGDVVYEIIIRTILVEKNAGTAKAMHQKSSSFVNAKAQAQLIGAIDNLLTPEESAVYHRGRNAKSHSVAKNADVQDYRKATGFEALMGHLYLSGQMERCMELVRFGLSQLEQH